MQIELIKNAMFKFLLENVKNETIILKKGNIKIKISMFNYILSNILINTSKINKTKPQIVWNKAFKQLIIDKTWLDLIYQFNN